MSLLTSVNDDDTDTPSIKHSSKGKEMRMAADDSQNIASKELKKGPWLDPSSQSYSRGKWLQHLWLEVVAMAHQLIDLEATESAFVMLAEDELANYWEAIRLVNADQWRTSMELEN